MSFPGMSRLLVSALLLTTATLTVAPAAADNGSSHKQQGCILQSKGSDIKRVLHLTFDNVHLRRDNPNVPSDLEQMPNLLNFLLENGVVSGNHHTPLISHTAHDIVTALTGVYVPVPAFRSPTAMVSSVRTAASDSRARSCTGLRRLAAHPLPATVCRR